MAQPGLHAETFVSSLLAMGLRDGRRIRLDRSLIRAAFMTFCLPGTWFLSTATAQPSDFDENRVIQGVFRDVAARLRPSLVRIETVGGAQPLERLPDLEDESKPDEQAPKAKRRQNPFRDNPGSTFVVADGPTTGIVWRADGYILASSFNFARDPALISVTLADGRRLAADLVARDQVRKLALLKIDADGLPVPEWVPIEEIRIGQRAVALGLGFGGDDPSLSVGIVSALHRMSRNAFQTDARLNPANYGGPVCDIAGRILGIAVPLAQRPGELAGVEMYDSGVGFALAKDRVDEITASLIKGESFHRGWLGMVVDPESTKSVVIENVADPSPLRTAGVMPGDEIVNVEGKDIKHYGQLVSATYMIPAGQEVYLSLKRDQKAFGVKVRLAKAADLGPLPELEEPLDPSEPLPPEPLPAEPEEK